MKPLFPRAAPDGDDVPVDVAQVNADDALIEALRQEPLFAEPTDAPTRWLRAIDDRTATEAATATAAIDADRTAADPVDGQDALDAPGALDAPDDLPGMPGAHAGLRDPSTAAADAQVAALLQAWRAELESVPLPPPVDTQIAAAVVRSAPARRHSVRPMIAVAAAIAGLLMGSTAISARSASPDDTLLWPVTQLLWGDRVEEVQASIQAREGIEDAAKAIDAGHPEAAEAALDHVTEMLDKVEDPGERASLESELDRIQSQLDSSRATSTPGTSAEPGSTAPATTGAPGVGPMAPGVPLTSATSPTRPSPAAPPTTAPAAQPTADAPESPPAPSDDAAAPETPTEPLPTGAPDPSVPTEPSIPEESPTGLPPVTTNPPTTTAPVGLEPPVPESPGLPPGLGQPNPQPTGGVPGGVATTASTPAGSDPVTEPAAG